LRDFVKLWLFKLIIVVVVVVNFISGLLNSINNKENNSKPEKGHSDKMIFIETCTLHWLRKTIGKSFENSARSLHLVMLKRAVFFQIKKQ